MAIIKRDRGRNENATTSVIFVLNHSNTYKKDDKRGNTEKFVRTKHATLYKFKRPIPGGFLREKTNVRTNGNRQIGAYEIYKIVTIVRIIHIPGVFVFIIIKIYVN